MLLRLAREMGCPAAELAERMSYAEFLEHCACDAVEPWGQTRADIHAAQVVSTLVNLQRRKGSKPVTIDDCRLKMRKKPKRSLDDPDEQMAFIGAVAKAAKPRKPKAKS